MKQVKEIHSDYPIVSQKVPTIFFVSPQVPKNAEPLTKFVGY